MPTQIKPEVGMGATYCIGSDKYACTIIRVSDSGKTFWMKNDKVKRIDSNGESENQTWVCEPNPDEKETKRVHLNPGRGWVCGEAGFVIVGEKMHYVDPNF